MKNHQVQSTSNSSLSIRMFILVVVCVVLAASPAGVAMAQKGGDPVPQKGLERGLQQKQESATPQPQCPKGMTWSSKEDKCVSTLKPQTQTGGGGGGKPPKGSHATQETPGGNSGR